MWDACACRIALFTASRAIRNKCTLMEASVIGVDKFSVNSQATRSRERTSIANASSAARNPPASASTR